MQSHLTQKDRQDLVYLRQFVGKILKCLLDGEPLHRDKNVKRLWQQYWGSASYSDRDCDKGLELVTGRRKSFLLQVFNIASDVIRKEEISTEFASELRARLKKLRAHMHPYMACVALAIDAALALLHLEALPPLKSLALCYSAFGEVSETARTYACELSCLFSKVFNELHLFACVPMEMDLPDSCKVGSVEIHFRNVTLSGLVAFPGIKAPGLIGLF